MNMLFWVWYAKHIEDTENDEEVSAYSSDADLYIPSPWCALVGLLVGVGIIGISWLLFKLFISM